MKEIIINLIVLESIGILAIFPLMLFEKFLEFKYDYSKWKTSNKYSI